MCFNLGQSILLNIHADFRLLVENFDRRVVNLHSPPSFHVALKGRGLPGLFFNSRGEVKRAGVLDI